MEQERISVIVPIYNVEPYIKNCLDSIVGQSYSNLEIILVDDGSPDRCGEICDDYAARDPRIRVIHKKNGGLSSARNTGLDVAKGDWICFVDPDDDMPLDACQRLMDLAVERQADIVVGNEIKFTGMELPQKDECQLQVREMDALDAQIAYFYRELPGYACGKLYRRQVIGALRFPEGRIFEDAFSVHQFLRHANKVVITNEVVYYYRQVSGSIVNSSYSAKKLAILEANQQAMELYANGDPALLRAIESKSFVSAADLLGRIPNDHKYGKDREKILAVVRKYRKKALLNGRNSTLVRGMAAVAMVSPSLLGWISSKRNRFKYKRV